MDIDGAHAELNKVVASFGSLMLNNANEAETRNKVIDVILRAVLGWTSDDISYEVRASEDGLTKFADYILRTATTSVVIEAKRVGASFLLPTYKRSGLLKGILSEGEIGEAIRQARDYARKLSIPYAAVTNGGAWVIFQASRIDSIPWEEGYASIFHGLEDIRVRLVSFWELLSRQRVTEGGLEASFCGKDFGSSGRRIVSLLPDGGYRLGRNGVYEHIEPAVNKALSDEGLLNDHAGLEACYIKSSERLKFDSRLKIHLRDVKVGSLDRKVVRVKSRKNVKHFDDKLDAVESTIQLSRFSGNWTMTGFLK